MAQHRKLIYDLGSNNGDDIPYYLLKADLVIAVEANPDLCDVIRQRFSPEIRSGRLIVENTIISVANEEAEAPFYVHKLNHTLSQFPRPSIMQMNEFREIFLKTTTVEELIRKWGDPYYVKVDLENYDAQVLKSMFKSGIYPSYLSAESHSIDVFCLLVLEGKYNSFKLVEGNTVHAKFAQVQIEAKQGKVEYSFPNHSAGPFGNDIPGPWFTADNFVRILGVSGLGWKDIHATNIHEPDRSARLKLTITN